MRLKSIHLWALGVLLLGACAEIKLPGQSGQPDQPGTTDRVPPSAAKINPMADVPGDKPLPALRGTVERIDCMTGSEDVHARIAFEARGGQITSFAYYSKWKPRTCAFDFERDTQGSKWRLTAGGDTRVHTPQGRFLIRTLPDAYVFEFEQVQRQKFCGMQGEINGSMTIKRGTGAAQCSVIGIMDTNDAYLDGLYRSRQK